MLLAKQDTCFGADKPLLGPEGVRITSRDHSPEVDDAISFLYYSMPDNVRDLVSNNSLEEIDD